MSGPLRHHLAMPHGEAVERHSEHQVGVVQQQVAVLVLSDAGDYDETQLDVAQTLLCLGVLHHNGAANQKELYYLTIHSPEENCAQ